MNASSSGSSPRNSPLAWSISPTTTPGPSDAVPSSRVIRPSIAASSVDLPEPFAPVIATRSAQSICRSTGPRVNGPRCTTAPRSTATTAPARGAAATCMRSSHSRRGSSTASSRSIIRSVCLALAACFSLDSTRSRADAAVRLGRQLPADVADALVGPGPLRPGARLQSRPGVRVLLVFEAGVPALGLPLGQVAGVPTAVVVDPVLRQVELQHPVDGRCRNRRSWLTSTVPARRASTKCSSIASPARSRSLVGSSSSSTSYRDSSSEASPARAA